MQDSPIIDKSLALRARSQPNLAQATSAHAAKHGRGTLFSLTKYPLHFLKKRKKTTAYPRMLGLSGGTPGRDFFIFSFFSLEIFAAHNLYGIIQVCIGRTRLFTGKAGPIQSCMEPYRL
jgi:hypothetical protein